MIFKLDLKYICFFLLTVSFSINSVYAQSKGYAKDSLQIKVYTEIEYVNSEAKDIKLLKVFCDYCSDFQSKIVGKEALRRAHDERNDLKNVLKNGKKKLAIIIRLSKTDFAGIENDSI